MMKLKAALCQTNVSVGALHPNAEKMVRLAGEARAAGAGLILFPEMALAGYPPEDLVLKRHFIEHCRREADWMAGRLPGDALVVVGAPHRADGRVYNAALLFHGGRLAGVYCKNMLPNYGVFDEHRVFEAGTRDLVAETGGYRIGFHVCEDSWITRPAGEDAFGGLPVDVLVNISASPYHRRKGRQRVEVLAGTARRYGACLLYANLVGGQDELVFDGASMAFRADGALDARARAFEDDLLYVSLPPPAGRPGAVKPGRVEVLGLPPLPAADPEPARIEPELDERAEVYAALKTGLRDYVDKNGFRRTVVALSGGIDSALVAAIAVDALGPGRVVGVTMPSRYSSTETRGDAELLARNLGIEFHTVPIGRLFEAYLEELAPVWPGREPDITEENLQARIRGTLIMALSNKFGWMVISTGNKSEMATGYCTIYGDMVGGFALIKDVPKTLVFALARWRNAQGDAPVIPPSTIERPPSAELRPDQKDSDSLPPYEILDPILERYVERDLGVDEIVHEGYDPATVQRVSRLVDANEYKRRQGAPGVKITLKAFGRDRRVPITNLFREHVVDGPRPAAAAQHRAEEGS